MNVITPGYEYELETTDLTNYPTGYITIKFNKPLGTTTQEGVIDSHEIIDMMIDRYKFFETTAADDSSTCALDYMLASKTENIVKHYVLVNE